MEKKSTVVAIGRFDVCIDQDHANYMSCAHRSRLKELVPHVTDHFVSSILVPLIDQKAQVSLRILDFLCTNYAKQENTAFPLKKRKHGTTTWFNIHLEYKKRLSAYKRRLFDPFQRRGRIQFTHDGQPRETTVAQLAFLIWAYRNKVLTYAMEHYVNIEACMTKSMARAKCRKLTEKKRKRSALTKAPTTTLFFFNETVTYVCDSDNEEVHAGLEELDLKKESACSNGIK